MLVHLMPLPDGCLNVFSSFRLWKEERVRDKEVIPSFSRCRRFLMALPMVDALWFQGPAMGRAHLEGEAVSALMHHRQR